MTARGAGRQAIEMVPAVDVRGGLCVGFVRGSLATERVYASDPVAVAVRWQAEGAAWLHVVDMDAALCGSAIDWDSLRRVVESVAISVQIGGRLRRTEDARRAFGIGARRVVMGPVADAPGPDVALGEVVAAAREFPESIVLALDVRDAREDQTRWSALEDLAHHAVAHGIRWLVVADASRDGTLEGPNVEAVERLKAPGQLRLMLSGGIGSADDLDGLRGLESDGLAAVIVGRALYDGHLNFRAARARLRGPVAD